MTCRILSLAMPLVALSTAISPAQTTPQSVDVAVKPGGRWTAREVRTLADVPGAAEIPPDAGLSRYGGLTTRKVNATGFFHTAKVEGRWWLVDPEGCLFLQRGVTSVGMIPTPAAEVALKRKFGSEAGWAEQSTGQLRNHGFNGLGAWSDTDRLRAVPQPLAYTRIWNFTLGLLESKNCVGWHWFKYIDNDPAHKKADASNRDSNKGLLNNRYEPYAPLLDAMKRINERAYGIVERFDRD